MENNEILGAGPCRPEPEPAGYQFRFQLGGASVRCIVRDASLDRWTRVGALGEMDALKRYARRIVMFHLRTSGERSKWLVEIGPAYVRCQVDDG